MTQQKTVLFAPLNWGLGHATRLVPVIELFLSNQVKVLLAADKRPYDFLKDRFPECEMIRLPGFEVFYPEKGSMALRMMLSFSDMQKKASEAHKLLEEIIEQFNVDIVISDNRYELSSSKAYSVFITHQLNIQTFGWQRLFKPIIRKITWSYIRKYDELWIPDFKDPAQSLSGKLSHVKQFPVENYHFTGPLSRFDLNTGIHKMDSFDLLVILSGPEPQRTIFEQMVTEHLLKNNLKATILQSKPEKKMIQQNKQITFISHADDQQMATLIKSADLVISRPGYSTIMDLSVFGKKAVFVPTPGQTEQIYLARELKNRGYCYFEEQASFNLVHAIEASKKYSGLPLLTRNTKPEALVTKLLSRSKNTPPG